MEVLNGLWHTAIPKQHVQIVDENIQWFGDKRKHTPDGCYGRLSTDDYGRMWLTFKVKGKQEDWELDLDTSSEDMLIWLNKKKEHIWCRHNREIEERKRKAKTITMAHEDSFPATQITADDLALHYEMKNAVEDFLNNVDFET